jgi:hypothetical protein
VVCELNGWPFSVTLSFVIVGLASLIFAAYRVWKISDDALDEANGKLNPKVRILGVAPDPVGDDYRRIQVQNLTATAVRFKAKLLETKPAISFHLPVNLRGTHVPEGDDIEVEPNGKHSVDVFIDCSIYPQAYQKMAGQLALVLSGNPLILFRVPRGERLELRICVFPISAPGGEDARWFYIVPQSDGTVVFTADGTSLPSVNAR